MKGIFKLVFFMSVLLVKQAVFSQEKLTPEKLLTLNRLSGGELSRDEMKFIYEVKEMSIEQNKGMSKWYVNDIKTGQSQNISGKNLSIIHPRWGLGNAIWFLSNVDGKLQLFKMNSDGSDIKQVSNVTTIDIEDFVISPNENYVIFVASVKVKQTLKEKYPDLPKAEARLEDDLLYRHWNYWNNEHVNHLFLHKIINQKVESESIDILLGEIYNGTMPPFHDSENIIFSNDESKVIYATKKTVGKVFAQSTNADLYEFDIKAGTTRNLTTGYMGYDLSPKFSVDGKKIAWLSMKNDGFESDKSSLIIRDLESDKDINLTKNVDMTITSFSISKDNKFIYFIAPHKGTTQLFEMNLSSEKIRQVTNGKFNVVSFSLGKATAIVQRQSITEPTDLFEVNLKTGFLKQVTAVNKNQLATVTMPTSEERWIKTHDGKDMLVWIVYPPNFDSNKKYPALLYCQGGPQSMVSQFFSYRWNLALMASNDYIIVAPNRRGLPGFGQEWNDAISGDWGGNPIKDYLSAIDEIAKEPFVDEKRLGAVGASYGGFSVYYLAGVHENRFKTFVSHCGLFNLESWYGTTEELFFANWENKGPYWKSENMEYYKNNSPHRLVQNWNTPMLVIHGGADYRVPESEGMQAFQAAQLLGLKSKFLLFPKEGHWITTPQNGILWYREFFEWLDSDLK